MRFRVFANLMRQSISVLCVLLLTFVLIEPAISSGATTAQNTFTIAQVINSELAFSVPASNVLLSPDLGGITGGTADGWTQFIVTAGSSSGYSVVLAASSSLGMIGNASSTNYIPAYAFPGITTPQFDFTVPANKAYFGYTVEASTTSDLSQAFKDDGASLCGTGSADTLNKCWLNASTTAVIIVSRATPTPASGATTTLKFRVTINSNPSPIIPDDTYVATTTLTATTN